MLSILLMLTLVPTRAGAQWTVIDPGMEYARFDACSTSSYDDSKITVVRVDPTEARLRLLAISDLGLPGPLRAEEWAARYDLALVINAGMFGADWRTHLGYLKVRSGHVNSGRIKDGYRSVLGIEPLEKGARPASLFDLETTSIPEVTARYGTVVQNIRMIRSPGKVVWSPSPRKWSEAALGMDRQGRLLFIFCRSPYPMREFSACLLQLPLGLVAAQHLEGGGDATIVVRTSGLGLTLVGSYETGANDGVSKPYEDLRQGFPLPNVLVVVRAGRDSGP